MSEDRSAGERGYGIPPPGFRLPAGTRPGCVRLQVSALERSLGYYQHVLGFRVLAHGGSTALLAAHDDDLVIIELHERRGAARVPPDGRLGLFHFAILLPDRASLGRFMRHLAMIGVRAGAADHHVSEALYLSDPDGLGIEVYADRPRSMWRRRDGEIVMTTDPLDTTSLLRAAAGEPWAGMPAGTTIGHVHLNVGDLERAAAFYHDGLGLDTVVRSYPGALFLSAGGYHHHLGVNTWASGAVPPDPGDARLLEWELIVPASADADSALGSLAAAGHPIDQTVDGGVVRDPWGTALHLRADR